MIDPPKQPEAPISIFATPEAEPDPAVSFRSHLDQLTPTIFVAYGILLINIVVFIGMALSRVNVMSPDLKSLIGWGADYGPLTTTSGQWWRLITSTFVHGGIVHLAFNMYVLYKVGPFMERLLGRVGFLVVYLVSGIGGCITSIAYNPFAVSVGASGAIFGLYGALLGFIVLRRDTIPSAILARLTQSALVFLGYNVVYGIANEGTDIAAHLGGLATGFVAGVALSSPLTIEMARRRLQRAAILAAVGLIAIVPAARALPRPPDYLGELDKLAPLEHRCVTAFNNALQRFRSGQLDSKSMANVVQHEVLEPWSAEQAKLASIERALRPGRPRIVFNRILDYVNARQEGWSLWVQGLRTGNMQMLAQAAAKQQQAVRLAERVKQ